MKTTITIIKSALIIMMTVCASSTNAQTDAKPTAAVLTIESKGVIPDAESVGNMMRLELQKTNRFNVIDRYEIDDVLRKNGIDAKTCFAKSCLLEAGKVLHADKMLTGSVERFGEKIAVSVKLVDVNTGTIENSDVTEYLNLQKEIHKMIEISVKKLLGIAPDKDMAHVLISYNQPIQSGLTSVNLSGPRAGIYYTDGIVGERMRADKTQHGGLGMYSVTSVIGWQQEREYLSSGNFQGLIEFIFTGSGLESGRFIPAFTFLNGIRLNRQGWELAFGPTFRFVRKAKGYYTGYKDENGNFHFDPVKDWHLESEWKQPYANPYPIVSNIDDRGDPALSTGLVIGVGKTFRSGYLNIPVNFYIIPKKEGTVYGLSFGFNVFKSSSNYKD